MMPESQLGIRRATLDSVLRGLMWRYKDKVPDVQAVLDSMKKAGIIDKDDSVENDHIAFRTIGVPLLGIQGLERIFTHLGYEKRDYFNFPSKKLDAYWFSPPEPKFPRIFISELRVADLTEQAQTIIRSYTNEVTSDPINKLDLNRWEDIDAFFHTPLWRLPSWDDFTALQKESEYAAWVIYNQYCLNHYTISVHNLPEGYNTVEQFNEFLHSNGFTLNSAGGEIKVSKDGLLIQSSTIANLLEVPFADGSKHLISGSYVEFAERKPLVDVPKGQPIGRDQRRDGFEASNADKIFESTYSEQTSTKMQI